MPTNENAPCWKWQGYQPIRGIRAETVPIKWLRAENVVWRTNQMAPCWKCSREDQTDGFVLKNDNCSCWKCRQNSTCWKCRQKQHVLKVSSKTARAENVDRKKQHVLKMTACPFQHIPVVVFSDTTPTHNAGPAAIHCSISCFPGSFLFQRGGGWSASAQPFPPGESRISFAVPDNFLPEVLAVS